MRRIKRGWGLTKKSWALLREHPSLIRFPLYGGVAMVLPLIIFFGPGFYLWEEDQLAGAIPLIALGLYVLNFVGFYFSVGLAACADMIFRGQEASISDGLAVSRSRLSQISGWAAVSAAISLVMGVLENQGGALGTVAARLVGMAWSLITFLAVPVIAIEGTGPFETIKRSASMFRERWGQQITGNLAIGGAALLFMLPAAVLVAAGIVVWASTPILGALMVAGGVLLMAIAVLVSQALSVIFGVALYRYALDGETVGGFTQEDLESAVKVKGRRGGMASPPGATPGTI
jgi:hypothetical protein